MIYRIDLPHPPSINNYYKRTRNGRLYIGPKGKQFRQDVYYLVLQADAQFRTRSSLSVIIEWIAPDERDRDIDNILKATFDALEYAQVFVNDSQIDLLRVIRMPVKKPGGLVVVLEEI